VPHREPEAGPSIGGLGSSGRRGPSTANQSIGGCPARSGSARLFGLMSGSVAPTLAPSRPESADPATVAPVGALSSVALAAVRSAALACCRHAGRGDPLGADGAATAAMRSVLGTAAGRGTVVVGEGEKDGAPMLYPGEVLGQGEGLEFDVAVDPLEGTKACAAGLPGALSTIALAESGALARLPGCSWYMEKLIVGPKGRGAVDIRRPATENAVNLASQLGKPVSALDVVVLDKPRHRELIAILRGLGTRVRTPRDGDVAAGLLALLEEGRIDLLVGIGGTPEGVLSACAARALGGEMQARLAPQREEEARCLAEEGVDLMQVYTERELAAGEAVFAACGVTDGELLRAPHQTGGWISTEAFLVSSSAFSRVIERSPVTGEDRLDGSGRARPPGLGSSER
jgi:fructose-1,6-bisphosphatase II